MKLPSPIPMDLAEMIAARLRVIGDPNRIRILDQLRDGELSVAQITERLGTSQQNASKHLGVLLQAGIVARRKEGTSSFYSVADQGVYDLCEQVCGGLQAQLAELTAMVEGSAVSTTAPKTAGQPARTARAGRPAAPARSAGWAATRPPTPGPCSSPGRSSRWPWASSRRAWRPRCREPAGRPTGRSRCRSATWSSASSAA